MQLKKFNFQSTPFLLLIGFFVLFLRAWPRLLYPEIWIEDGTLNLAGFINEGAISIFSPVGGYLTIIPKLITLTSLSISFIYYPLISTILAWIITLFIFLAIVKFHSYLRGRLLLAISCFFIPSDPEVFGLPSYTFWWSSLLLFMLVFWKEEQNTKLRLGLLSISSLSAPICVITLPLFWARAIFFRKPSEWMLAVFASIFTLIQISVMMIHNNPGHLNITETLTLFIPVFFGSYLVGNLYAQFAWIFGIFLFLTICIGAYKNRNWVMASLIYLLISSILISAYRVELTVLNPIHAGPRYFFYPYILISWILIQLLFTRQFFIKYISGLFLLVSCLNALPHLDRRHDKLNWELHVMNCINSQIYTFPIHFAGDKNNAWSFNLNGEQCQRLVEKDFFRKRE